MVSDGGRQVEGVGSGWDGWWFPGLGRAWGSGAAVGFGGRVGWEQGCGPVSLGNGPLLGRGGVPHGLRAAGGFFGAPVFGVKVTASD